jgi:hypothetical protein
MDKVGIKSLLKHIEMIGFDFRQIFTFLLILVGMRLAAQTNARGYVFNNKAEPIGYATLSLLNPADSTLAFFGISLYISMCLSWLSDSMEKSADAGRYRPG